MRITGDKELVKALEALDRKARTRITRAALRKAGEPVVAKAALNVADVSETIADSIGTEAKSFNKGAFHVLKVGPVSDSGAWRTKRVANPFTGDKGARIHKPHKTAHLVEGGTKPHTIQLGKLTIRHPGTEARPFLEPARRAMQAAVERVYVREAWKGIEREAKRAARKKN